MMKPRELSAAIRHCKTVYAWLWLTDDSGLYIQISKTEAQEFINGAKEDELSEVLGFVEKDEVFIGDDESPNADVEEGAEEDGEEEDLGEEEEETEEEGLDEEEETEEEEEAPKPAAAAAKKRK